MNCTEKHYLYIEERKVLHTIKTALKMCAILQSSKWKKQGREVTRWASCYWIHKHRKVLIKCVSPYIKFMAYSTTYCESFHTKCSSLWRESSRFCFQWDQHLVWSLYLWQCSSRREENYSFKPFPYFPTYTSPKKASHFQNVSSIIVPVSFK